MRAAATDTIPFHDGLARVIRREQLAEIPEWPRVFASQAKDHRFYEIVDETLEDGFEHRYLMFEDRTGRVRGVQPVFFVRQNLVEGVPAFRRAVDLVRRKFPRFLTMRVLMVGCAAGAAHLGACCDTP